VSLPSVLPSAFITWFQAQEAYANSGKRLPTIAECAGSPRVRLSVNGNQSVSRHRGAKQSWGVDVLASIYRLI